MTQGASESDIKKEFETVLNNELGQFGKYQFINILLLAIPAAASGFMAGDYVFTAGRLPYRCAVPLCDQQAPEYSPNWILNAIPETSTGFEDCFRYATLSNTSKFPNEICPADLFDRNTIIPCEGYVYGRTNTVVYDFGLECQEWLRALAGTLNSMGAMIALPLAGFVSDYFGRRISIVFFAFNVALVGLVKAFSINYTMYVILQFLHTAIGGGLYSAAYILATELVGSKFRVATSATMSSMFAFGQALLGGIAAAVHEWRKLTMTLFTPVFSLLSYYWIATESHRWLLSKNRNDEAKAVLEKAARLNGTKISDNAMNILLTSIPRLNNEKKDVYNKPLFIRVINSPVMLRRCCTTPIYWIATTFIYYGLSINSVSLSGNMYLNYVLTSLIEIPGYFTAYLILDKIGRKVTLFCGFILCSLCCFAFSFIPNHMYVLSLVLYLTGKFSTGVIFTSLYLFTSELYPTRHRHSFLGFSSMLGRIGSVVSPLTPPLMVYWPGIPSILFATMAGIAGILVLTQPETRGLKIPDTFEEAEQIGRKTIK
ncbi:organic cation transporter protein-like [Melitaea cinxia]|uniref:organic cation transporter protein-like n=1 Tax=Melitaea cinxia TaxID=113334 RepID=UPI001E2720AE|nr:organic cation transporter protein-like [Melitaea cinxia]